MDYIVVVKVVYRVKDLSNGLRRILLGKFPSLTNTVEEFSAGS